MVVPCGSLPIPSILRPRVPTVNYSSKTFIRSIEPRVRVCRTLVRARLSLVIFSSGKAYNQESNVSFRRSTRRPRAGIPRECWSKQRRASTYSFSPKLFSPLLLALVFTDFCFPSEYFSGEIDPRDSTESQEHLDKRSKRRRRKSLKFIPIREAAKTGQIFENIEIKRICIFINIDNNHFGEIHKAEGKR